MRNNKGVTLIYLVVTIIIMVIFATITVTGSLTAYKTMKYETFKAELQEVEEAVLEISEDYAMYKKNNSSASYSYSDYFTDKFGAGNEPTLATDSSITDVTTRLSDYPDDLIAGYTYYFDSDDLGTYMGLEVSALKAVLVDFSTDIICSVEGIADPDDSSTYYYLLSEINGGTVYAKEISSGLVESSITVDCSSEYTVGTTKMKEVKLSISTDYPIKKAYFTTGDGYVAVDNLGDCTYSDDGKSVSFVIYPYDSSDSTNVLEYSFMIEDSTGTEATATTTIEY